MNKKKQLEATHFLCGMILIGVKDNDKDCVRSHLEDLNGFLIEHNLVAE